MVNDLNVKQLIHYIQSNTDHDVEHLEELAVQSGYLREEFQQAHSLIQDRKQINVH